MIEQLHTFLLPVNNNFVKMRGAYLLGFDDQIILLFVCKIDLYLVKINLLVRIGIHLGYMLRVKVFNTANVNVSDVQNISSHIILRSVIPLG